MKRMFLAALIFGSCWTLQGEAGGKVPYLASVITVPQPANVRWRKDETACAEVRPGETACGRVLLSDERNAVLKVHSTMSNVVPVSAPRAPARRLASLSLPSVETSSAPGQSPQGFPTLQLYGALGPGAMAYEVVGRTKNTTSAARVYSKAELSLSEFLDLSTEFDIDSLQFSAADREATRRFSGAGLLTARVTPTGFAVPLFLGVGPRVLSLASSEGSFGQRYLWGPEASAEASFRLLSGELRLKARLGLLVDKSTLAAGNRELGAALSWTKPISNSFSWWVGLKASHIRFDRSDLSARWWVSDAFIGISWR